MFFTRLISRTMVSLDRLFFDHLLRGSRTIMLRATLERHALRVASWLDRRLGGLKP